jgi:FkbM family methyltransferase
MLRGLKSCVRPLLPKQVASHRILSGPLKGHIIITSWHDYPAAILGLTERPLLEWLSRNVFPEETWLDVGGHYGYTALALAKLVGSRGRVFVFEPVLSTAGFLTETCKRNGLDRVTVVPIGLDNAPSLETRRLQETRGMADLTAGNTGRVVDIRVMSLDQLWKSLAGDVDRIDGIKIDVQGMEHGAVSGMTQLLHRFNPKLVIEFHRGVNRVPIIDLLADAGYQRMGFSVDKKTDAELFEDDRSYAFRRAVRTTRYQ